MQGDYPVMRDVVLVGGGHAHALVARMWAMAPLPGARLTLINPGPAAPYTGMLPGLIAGHYRRDEIMIDLVRLARFVGARLIQDRAVGIDTAARQIVLQDRPPLPYDVASIDIGIGSDLPDLPGFARDATAAKPLGDYATAWEAFVARRLAYPRVVVIGGGVGGVELALASAHRLRSGGAQPKVTLVERATEILPHIGAGGTAQPADPSGQGRRYHHHRRNAGCLHEGWGRAVQWPDPWGRFRADGCGKPPAGLAGRNRAGAGSGLCHRWPHAAKL